MKKTCHDVWIFPLPSGLEIHLRDVPQKDIDFLDSIEQKTTRIAELEAVLRECRETLISLDTNAQFTVAKEAIASVKEG